MGSTARGTMAVDMVDMAMRAIMTVMTAPMMSRMAMMATTQHSRARQPPITRLLWPR